MHDSMGSVCVNCFVLWPSVSRALVAVCQASLWGKEGTVQMVCWAGRMIGIEGGVRN